MSCIIGQSKHENHIEIEPMGCRPVSPDVCKSGFMAPSENITKPEKSLDQCCKCKAGESCAFCIDPNKCSKEEKGRYVASDDDDCFSDDTEEYEPVPPEKPMDAFVPETEPDTEVDGNAMLFYILGFGFFLFLIAFLSLTR